MHKALFLLLLLSSPGAYAQKAAPASGQGVLKSKEDSAQYAAGVYIAQWILANGFQYFNPNTFMLGIEDRLRKKTSISDSTAFAIIANYKEGVARDLSKKMETNLFTMLRDKQGLGKLPSGVQYLVRTKGAGPRPSEEDSILINFRGALADGTVFEDTYAKKISVATTPKALMPGMNEAVQMMPAGSVWELYIPSEMAYGEKGNGRNIPPNNAVIILVELVTVKRNR
ncbi:FKBP-type peptidyl-prolyl cis-trans isomerase [Sediminibacterium soli]|uniref:FKBP-type peptidyl-prolyl cis-trans isomerase n=1 Tax=Sediminibacterium soli TaxID=2698829 RepID=UPI001379D586|nr:FKBP-type peptidyl-prolyl cis-trans isomerase [Sediminibacterium soli]NCI45782.1 hypothetical protein [Sediminibacterium soli]